MKQAGKTCSEEDIMIVTKLFENHEFIFRNGVTVTGFFCLYLRLTMYEADPKVFFQLLKIDQKIGWTNPADVERRVFMYKGIQIIEDEKVTDRAEHFYI